MKKTILILGVSLLSQGAYASAFDDSQLARSETLSPFDRTYEAGRAQQVMQPIDYKRSTQTPAAPAAMIDLSIDSPVASVEETETERQYRKTLEDLERNRQALTAARSQAERNLIAAQKTAIEAAAKRKQDLLAQEAEIRKALELNRAAQSKADQVQVAQLTDIEQIRTESKQLLMLAENNAEMIETAARKRVTLERVDPTVVINEPVEAEYQGATLKEIVEGIMPVGWRVKTAFYNKPELETRRYEFISTDARDIALRKLTASVRDARVRYQYFWDLTDEQGNPSPMILITDRPN
ncbi:hypothetical protein NOX69_003498 [Pseudomonas aeruginosa]|nr:hypothetical protein [Pseudomonas aeruginosa]